MVLEIIAHWLRRSSIQDVAKRQQVLNVIDMSQSQSYAMNQNRRVD